MKFTDYRTFKTAIGGKLLELEIGKVCELANGQVMVRYGDTVVNVTACASKEPRPDIDFFPLSCDYEEKMYAAGKAMPGVPLPLHDNHAADCGRRKYNGIQTREKHVA